MTPISEHSIFISSCYTTYLQPLNHNLLIEIVENLEKISTSNRRSNRGGWQSLPYEKTRIDNGITMNLFSKFIEPLAQKIVDSWGLPLELQTYNYWYNINRKYNYNSAHTHPTSYISGVYYIKVPVDSGRILFDRSENESDRLHFQTRYLLENSLSVDNPRINTEHWFRPEEGMLLLFPGHLKHSVEQNLTTSVDDRRISLSFNFFNALKNQS